MTIKDIFPYFEQTDTSARSTFKSIKKSDLWLKKKTFSDVCLQIPHPPIKPNRIEVTKQISAAQAMLQNSLETQNCNIGQTSTALSHRFSSIQTWLNK